MPVNPQSQAGRREALKRILERSPASTQRELVEALRAAGFHATQSSVSRDLADLGAVKAAEGYRLPRGAPPAADEFAQVADLLRGVATAGPHILVIKTAIGAAQRVALALDRAQWPEIVGNVGGDDTVFAATATAAAQRSLLGRIHRATGRA